MSEQECREEQLAEFEALESIYVTDLKVEKKNPHHIFTILLKSYETNDSTRHKDAVACRIRFQYTPLYPNEAPIIELQSKTLADQHTTELEELMNEQVEENLGMVMVFTISAAVLDRLNEIFDSKTKEREEATERALQEAEAEERKKFEGTRCTVENFMAWKIRFDAERSAAQEAILSRDENRDKLSGYDLFMRDKTLDESDLQFLDADDGVNVDESLFDDIEDLELAEEVDS